MKRIASMLVTAGAAALCLGAQGARGQATYTLKPSTKTVAWGYYAAKTAPVLRVKSGDTAEIQTLRTNSPKGLEGAGVPPDQVTLGIDDRADRFSLASTLSY